MSLIFLKLKALRVSFGFWKEMQKASEADLSGIETALGITLPVEYKSFLQKIGYGEYNDQAGTLYDPDTVIKNCFSALSFTTGSLAPGSEWADEEQHVSYWISNGENNPAPERFTDDKTTLSGVRLLDLVLVGNDGGSGYYFLDVRSSKNYGAFYHLYYNRIEKREPSFYSGVGYIIDVELELKKQG